MENVLLILACLQVPPGSSFSYADDYLPAHGVVFLGGNVLSPSDMRTPLRIQAEIDMTKTLRTCRKNYSEIGK